MPESKDIKFAHDRDLESLEGEKKREDMNNIYDYVKHYLEYFKGEALNMSESVATRQMIQEIYDRSIVYWQRIQKGRHLQGDRSAVLSEIADDIIELFLTTYVGLPSDIMGSHGRRGGFTMDHEEIMAIWKKRNRDTELI